MKKKCVLAMSLIVLSSFTFCIIPVNAAIIPKIIPCEPPWEGVVNEPIDFYASVSDPSRVFIDDEPFDWEWVFTKGLRTERWSTDLAGCGPTEEPEWFWNHVLFDQDIDHGDWEVEITVTNNVDETITWPYYSPHPNAYVHIGFQGDLECDPPRVRYNIFTRLYDVWVWGQNIGEDTCEGGWTAAVFYDDGYETEKIFNHDLVKNDYIQNYNFKISFGYEGWPLEWHKVSVKLDYHEERYEGQDNEDNNENYIWHFFWI